MTQSTYSPLVEPPDPQRPWWRHIPLIGWIVWDAFEMDWRKPKWNAVYQQIAQRDKPVWEEWGDNPARIDIAKVVCEEIQEEYEWPNPHFLPQDPLKVLITHWASDADFSIAMRAVERRLNIRDVKYELLTGNDARKAESVMTLSQLVDLFLNHKMIQAKPND